MKALLFALLVGCAPQGMATSAHHPANPDAPTGRLAGPPAALRAGVADVSTPTRGTTTTSNHSSHGAEPPAPAKTEPAKTEPANAKPAPKKSAPTKPTEKPLKQDKPKPTPPPAHQGHEGHQ